MSETFSDMEPKDPVLISEKVREEDSVRRRLMRMMGEAMLTARRLAVLCAFLVPIMLAAILTPDLPFRLFDGVGGLALSELPSNWMARGDFLILFIVPVILLTTRVYSAVFAGRILGFSWLIVVALAGMLLIYLAPELSRADFPSLRFALVFLLSWYIGPLFAAYCYDVTRGGNWWRAPLYGGVIGYAVQVAIYFPGLYLGTGAPWISWMILDFAIKCVVLIGFLPFYFLLRRRLKPYLGRG